MLRGTNRWKSFLHAKMRGFRGGLDDYVAANPRFRGAPNQPAGSPRFGAGLSLSLSLDAERGRLGFTEVDGKTAAVLHLENEEPIYTNRVRRRGNSTEADFGGIMVRVPSDARSVELERDGTTRKFSAAPLTAAELDGAQRTTVKALTTYSRLWRSEFLPRVEVELVEGPDKRLGVRFAKLHDPELSTAIPNDLDFWLHPNTGLVTLSGRGGETSASAGAFLTQFPAAQLEGSVRMVRDHKNAGLWGHLEILKGHTSAMFGGRVSNQTSIRFFIPEDQLPASFREHVYPDVMIGAYAESRRSHEPQSPFVRNFRWLL